MPSDYSRGNIWLGNASELLQNGNYTSNENDRVSDNVIVSH